MKTKLLSVAVLALVAAMLLLMWLAATAVAQIQNSALPSTDTASLNLAL